MGIVTSADAAAPRDILRTAGALCVTVDVLLASTLVRSSEAPAQIERRSAAQIAGQPQWSDWRHHRGAGPEARWEGCGRSTRKRVAAPLLTPTVPVVSGVGHEVDYAIADFGRCACAATPTARRRWWCPISASLRETNGRPPAC
ncbi:MAG: hypothetical protein IPM84_15045 [Anaerolineae bacterium]|nr:hypothetical protein [Anaerolineae bacterium]